MGLFRLILRTVLALPRFGGAIREHTGGKLFPWGAQTAAAFNFTQPSCCSVEKLCLFWMRLTMDRIHYGFPQGFGQLSRRLAGTHPRSPHALHSADETFHRPPPPVTRRQALRHAGSPLAARRPVGAMHGRRNPTANAR